MKLAKVVLGLSLFWVLVLSFSFVSAAIKPEDFVFKGIKLGDMIHRGIHVIRYTYSKDMLVYVDDETKKIVEIFTKSKHYVHQAGPTYGASKAGLLAAFGKADRRMLEGRVYNIYYNPADATQKIMAELEPEKSYLISWTFTSLSLEDEPAVIIRHDYNSDEDKEEKRFKWGN